MGGACQCPTSVFAQYWGFSHGNEKAGHGAGEDVGRIRSQLVLFPSIKMLLKPVGYREPK